MTPSPLSTKHLLAILCVFAGLALIIYSRTINGPFIFDDIPNIVDNQHIRMTKINIEQIKEICKSPSPRPVANLSFALNYYFGGYNVIGYRVVNLMIHIFTGILLFLFIINMLNSPINTACIPKDLKSNSLLISFFAALIWIVHPVNTQSVTYVVQRMNAMAAMFYMLSFLCYIKGRKARLSRLATGGMTKGSRVKPIFWFIGCAISGILAFSSKQNSATLPLFIVLYEWFFFQDLKQIWPQLKILWIGFAVLVLSITALIFIKTDPASFSLILTQNFTLPQRLLTEARIVLYYISLFFYPAPVRLSLTHSYPLSVSAIEPFTTLLCIIGITTAIFLAVYLAKKDRIIAFCILWFFGNLVIESSFIPLALIFEHRTYLPSMMVYFLIVTLLFRSVKHKWTAFGLMGLIILILSIWTFQRNNVWSDEISLWRDGIKKSPNITTPHINLGEALQAKGKTKKAIDCYLKVLSISPNNTKAHINMGAALLEHKNYDKAFYHFKKALKNDPLSKQARLNLGNILFAQNKTKQAMNYYLELLKLYPDYTEAHNNLGNVLIKQRKFKKAVLEFSKVLKAQPMHLEAHINMGAALSYLNQNDKAIAHYSKALQIDPYNEEIYNNMGVVLIQKKEYNRAIKHFKKAIEINPDYTNAKNNLKRLMAIIQNNRRAD